MDSIDEIKSRISIEDLVSQYIPLKKAGRHFKALCPFHQERTPSFVISPERQLAYCFGCHKGGDHFKFIQEMEGLDFRRALEFLAEKTGVKLAKIAPQEKDKKSQRDRLIIIHEEAARFFENNLLETAEGKKVLGYLKKRGLRETTIRQARLGFAFGKNDVLYSFLLEKGFTRDEIINSGLVTARDTNQDVCVDRFRMRLMFPIWNLAGDICAFGGRALQKGDEPKYLNSPETSLYHKSELLYGLSQAKVDIRLKKTVILVEGYMDALAARQAGYLNTVACGGTALTENQLTVLKRFTKDILLAFDRDIAGKLATERAIELGIAQNFSLRVIVWENDAKDPDECISKNPSIFAKAVESASGAFDYLLKHFQESFDRTTIDGRKKILEVLLPFLNRIGSPVELDEWLKKCSLVLNSSISSLYDELKRFQGKQKIISLTLEDPSFPVKKKFSIQEYFLGLLLTNKDFSIIANQLISPEDFEDIELQNIYRSLTTEYNQTLDDKESERAAILSIYGESRLHDFHEESIKKEFLETIRTMKHQKFERLKKSLLIELRAASSEEKTKLLDAYQELLAQEEQFSIHFPTLWPRK